MAKRYRREVFSRLVPLLLHLLKWEFQPEQRTGSWRGTILEQRSELRLLLESGTLYNHALAILAETYAEARMRASAETGRPRGAFPAECRWVLGTLLIDEEDTDDGGVPQ
jgi:hypothetical protein